MITFWESQSSAGLFFLDCKLLKEISWSLKLLHFLCCMVFNRNTKGLGFSRFELGFIKKMEKEPISLINEISTKKDMVKLKVRIVRLWRQTYKIDMILMDEKFSSEISILIELDADLVGGLDMPDCFKKLYGNNIPSTITLCTCHGKFPGARVPQTTTNKWQIHDLQWYHYIDAATKDENVVNLRFLITKDFEVCFLEFNNKGCTPIFRSDRSKNHPPAFLTTVTADSKRKMEINPQFVKKVDYQFGVTQRIRSRKDANQELYYAYWGDDTDANNETVGSPSAVHEGQVSSSNVDVPSVVPLQGSSYNVFKVVFSKRNVDKNELVNKFKSIVKFVPYYFNFDHSIDYELFHIHTIPSFFVYRFGIQRFTKAVIYYGNRRFNVTLKWRGDKRLISLEDSRHVIMHGRWVDFKTLSNIKFKDEIVFSLDVKSLPTSNVEDLSVVEIVFYVLNIEEPLFFVL